MYHYVRDLKCSRYPRIKGLDSALFREQLNWLNSNFTIIRMEDLLMARDGGKLPNNAALLTFDDGYADHYTTVFPLLDEMGIQGSFFPSAYTLEKQCLLEANKIHFMLASTNINELHSALISELRSHSQTVEVLKYTVPYRFDDDKIIFIKQILQTVLTEDLRKVITDKLFRQFVCVDESVLAKELYCDVAQLITMKKHGMFIGVHGYNHDWLGNMQKDEYEKDITKALDFMDSARLIDKNAWVMNYPYGSQSADVVEFIRENGCVAGITTVVARADLQTDDMLLLPRLDTNYFPPKSEEYKKYMN
jgi:peptidoglycan/xylan/chitin deacetylase (PgdA/CDA1 family)